MTHLEWTEDLEVGHPEIDRQHKQLCLLIHAVVGPLTNSADHGPGAVPLQALIDFTQEHFAFEEGLMRSAGYPEAELHAKHHASLLAELRIYCSKVEWGKRTNPVGLIGFLWNWFVVHIGASDRELVAWLNSRDPDARPPVATISTGVPIAQKGMNDTPISDDIDPAKLFDRPAQPAPFLEVRPEAERQEATAGANELLRTGYYITISNKAPKVAPVRHDGRYCVLCIDDDIKLLEILTTKLSFDGYAIRTAFDRETVVSELQKLPAPHLILLDGRLPDFSGFDLLKNLRQHRRLGSIPVIMLTGEADLASVLRGMASGADGYVSKPFQFDALGTAIETVLGIH